MCILTHGAWPVGGKFMFLFHFTTVSGGGLGGGGCDERMSRTGHVCLAWLLFPDIKKYETVFHQLSSFFSFVIFFKKMFKLVLSILEKKTSPECCCVSY